MISFGSSSMTRSSAWHSRGTMHLVRVDRGIEQEVHQGIAALAVGGALRDGVEVGPDLAALLAEDVVDLRNVAVQLLAVAGPADAEPGVAVAERRLVVAGDGEEMRLGLDQQLLGVGQFLRVDRVEGIAIVFERVADGGQLVVVDRDAAAVVVAGQVPEFLPGGRVVLDLVGVDREAGGAPVLGRGIDRAVDGALGDLRGSFWAEMS